MKLHALMLSSCVVLFACGPQNGSGGPASSTVPGFPSAGGGGSSSNTGGGAPAGGGVGGVAGGGTGLALGGGSGVVDDGNHAEQFWNAYQDARQRMFALEADEARRPLAWLRTAAQAAGHVVTSGTLTEDAQGQYTYSAGGDTLHVVRASGGSFDVEVLTMTGDPTDGDFPGNQDSLETHLTLSDGRVWYSSISGDRNSIGDRLSLTYWNGVFDDDDTGEQLQASLSSWSSASGSADTSGSVTIAERKLGGTIVRGDTTVQVDLSSFVSFCSGTAACSSRYESSDVTANVTRGSTTAKGEWVRKVDVQTLSSPATVTWSGTITRDGNQVGVMTKRPLVQNEVSLDVQLDGDVWVTETVFGN